MLVEGLSIMLVAEKLEYVGKTDFCNRAGETRFLQKKKKKSIGRII